MATDKLTADYWEARYREHRTGWDLGAANAGLVREVTTRFRKTDRLLIPGAGRAHEAVALWRAGFRDTYVLDWSARALDAVRASPVLAEAALSPGELRERLVHDDFFAHAGDYDGLIEQTFFCAIDPQRRDDYVHRAHRLLAARRGRWVGILFDREFPTAGPPFGGTRAEYRARFAPHFDIEVFETFAGSVAPRRDAEVLGVMRCRTAG